MHGDPRARPCRIEDYGDTLAKPGALPDVVAFGAYQMNHVWTVTLKTAEATNKLLAAKDVNVKDRPCLLIELDNYGLRIKIHWVLHGVSDEDVGVAFLPYGRVTKVTREKWRAHGVTKKASTTRTASLKLKSGVKIDDIPHQQKIAGEMALVVVPGRAPLCLRCKNTGHIRRDCRVPRCNLCRRFGHDEAQCTNSVASYAAVTAPAKNDDLAEHMMDEADAEETARGTSNNVSTMIKLSPLPGEGQKIESKETMGQNYPSGGHASRVPTTKEAAGSASSEETMKSSNETLPMDVSGSATPSAVVKRSQEDNCDANDAFEDATCGESPAKTATTRRLRYLEAERSAADETPPHMLCSAQLDADCFVVL